jgi:thymidylate synthase
MIDAHIYTSKADGSMSEYDHVPGLRTQLERAPRKLPRLTIAPSIRSLDDLQPLLEADTETVMKHFVLEGYDPAPAIPFKVAV